MTAIPAHPKVLLDDVAFVRAVAKRLLRDEHDADDVAQQAMVNAMGGAPPSASRRRGWLATITRNLARNYHRDASRRAGHEAARSASQAAPSAAEIVEREEIRRMLVDAVLRLDEPFRTTLLLRYWEGLEPAEIAKRQGIPGATVRTRLLRGTERLKAALDRKHKGDRSAWRAALAPLAARGLTTSAGTALMTWKQLSAVASIAVLGACLVWSQLGDTHGGASPTHVADGLPPVVDDRSTSEPDEPDLAPRVPSRVIEAPRVADEGPRVYPRDVLLRDIAGIVLDAELQPVADAEVRLKPYRGTLPRSMQIKEDRAAPPAVRSATDGTFRFAAVPSGPWLLAAEDDERRGARIVVPGRDASVTVELAPRSEYPSTVAIRVVDEAGRFVPNVALELHGASKTRGVFTGDPDARGTTDAAGRAEFELGTEVAGVVFATGEDGRVGSSNLYHLREVRITLAQPTTLRGRLIGVPLDRLEGLKVTAHLLSRHAAYYTTHRRSIDGRVEGDRYVVEGLPAATTVGITIESPQDVRLVLDPVQSMDNTAKPLAVALKAGGTEQDLQLAIGGSIHGSARDSEGNPVPNAEVMAVLIPPTGNYTEGFVLHGTHVWRLDSPPSLKPKHPQTFRFAKTDRNGHYRLHGLQPGRHRVEVIARGLHFDRHEGVEVKDGATTQLAHHLSADGVLQGLVTDSYVGVRPFGKKQPTAIAIVRSGVFTFPGLKAGRYEVLSYHSNSSVDPRPLGTAEVFAGRTTWVDFSKREPLCVLSGLILGGSGPIRNARLRFGRDRSTTDDAGQFRMELSYRIQQRFGSSAIVVRAGDTIWNPELPKEVDNVDSWNGVLEVGIHALDVEPSAPFETMKLSGEGTTPNGTKVSVESTRRSTGPTTRFDNLPAGKFTLVTRFANGSSVIDRFEVPAPEAIRPEAPACGEVELLVLDRLGQPIAGREFELATWNGDGDPPEDQNAFFAEGTGWSRLTTDAEGKARARGVVAGSVLVRLRVSGFSLMRGKDPRPSTRIEVAAGATTPATIRMESP